MAEKPQQRRSTVKRAGIMLGVLLLLGAVAWGWFVEWPRFQQTPAYIKFSVKQYLRRHAVKERPGTNAPVVAVQAATNSAAQLISVGRQKIAAATTYGAMYQVILTQLEAAEPRLAARDTDTQREGFLLAATAARHAGLNAENYWLAARIAEAWLLPNLRLADPPGDPRGQTVMLLQFCNDMFAQNQDTNLYLRTTRLQLQHTPNPQKADAMRYAMALELETMELKREAMDYLREITDPDLAHTVKRRLYRLEREIPRPKADPKNDPKPAPKPAPAPVKKT